MTEPLNLTTSRTAHRDLSPAEGPETEPAAFRDALDRRLVGELAAILNPSATASLPGAGVALAEAINAPPADASGLAAQELAAQQQQQGIRERGLDAASASARELATRSQGASGQPSPQDQAEGARPEPARADRPAGTDASAEFPSRPVNQPATGATGSAPSASKHAPASNAAQATSAIQANASAAASPGQPGPAPTSASAATQAVTRMARAFQPAQTQAQPTTQSGRPSASPPFSIDRAAAGATGSSRRSAEAQASPRQDPTAQVQRGLAQVLRQRGGTLTLKLTPHELGEVRIALKTHQSRVEGTIEARTVAARDLLRQNIDALKASLEHRGVTVDRLEVRLQGAAESDPRAQSWAEARSEHAHTRADAGGDRSTGFAGGGDRHTGGREGQPGAPDTDAERGAPATVEDDGHGRPDELAGGWLRLDTTA